MSFKITTDACSDLTVKFASENNVSAIKMEYILEGKSNFCTLETTANSKPFYDIVRSGAMPSTSMINSETHKEFFEPFLKGGEDVLHIAFSSGLSGTCDGAITAAQELSKKYPDRKILVVDSLCASMGEGLLVYKAVKKRDSGATITETQEYIESLKKNLVHMFTVDSLSHLQRGGRVSKVTAVVGTMLKIKPVLHVNDDGKLVALSKVKGRKKSLDALAESMIEKIKGYEAENDVFFVSHGDAEEDANYLIEKIKKETGIKNCLTGFIGPIIGAHSGPGTIALFFIGSPR